MKTALIVIAIVAALLLVIPKLTSGKAFSSSHGNGLTPHDDLQGVITRDIAQRPDHWNKIKTGGASGVPANSKTVKPMIYDTCIEYLRSVGRPVPSDGWQAYQYPGLQVDENAKDGLERDHKGGGILSTLGGIFGAAAGTAIAPGAGTAIGAQIGGGLGGALDGFDADDFENFYNPFLQENSYA